LKTLLILDDEKVLREALAAYFEDRLWQPLLAENAEEALLILEVESPAAILVDIHLKDMGGDDFIRKARQTKPNLAFVIYTGSHEYEIPADILEYRLVSQRIFKKPVYNLPDLENEIIRMIIQAEESGKTG
jgi:DNA-binding NtrC family response regulator